MKFKEKLPFRLRLRMKNALAFVRSIGSGCNLDRLGKIYRTDKYGIHWYTQHYMTHFRRFKFKRIRLFEIGVGEYEDTQRGGNSLRMWRRYFPFGKIFSIDIYDKSQLQERRIKIFQGSQVDEAFLNEVNEAAGGFDIIIDDGSHINEHIIESFRILFPKLKDGGIYVVEDIQTSYWPEYGGDSDDLGNPHTAMNFFKGLVDCLNHSEFIIPGYERSYYDSKIIAMHFYHNMVFICKGDNDEKSNIIVDNRLAP